MDVDMDVDWEGGRAFLAQSGLNLVALLPLVSLPTAVVETLTEDARRWPYLLLLGHGGRFFWDVVQASWPEGSDPVDTFSTAVGQQFLAQFLPHTSVKWLYPTQLTNEMPLPLQQLGQAAGWAHSSPLGLGISPHFGVWFAYRAACLLGDEVALPTLREQARPSPCETCVTRPCVSACPAHAVVYDQTLNISVCVAHRLAEESTCAHQCLARLACPVAPEHRYAPAQIAYHYGVSLRFLQAWSNQR
jgi:epoxyqueuosine reductase